MQLPTHLLVGALIEKAAGRAPPPARRSLTIIAGLLSHRLLDLATPLTYHPPDARPRDPFWLGYHIGLLALTVAVVRRYRRLGLGMFAAALPDIDWLIAHPARALGLPIWREPHLHRALESATAPLAAPGWVTRSGDRRDRRSAALVEVAVIAALLAANRRSDPPSA